MTSSSVLLDLLNQPGYIDELEYFASANLDQLSGSELERLGPALNDAISELTLAIQLDAAAPSAKPTYIENFLDIPEYVEKLNELLSLVPTELEDLELGQAWADIARFQTTIKNFYESESEHYTADLNEQASELVSKTRVQREAIEAEVDKRRLRYSFRNMSAWEPDYDQVS